MNRRARGILYGMAIGDGGVYLSKDQSAKTARLVIGHGPSQIDYLHYKARLLHSILGGNAPKVYTSKSTNKKTGKIYTNHQLYKNHKYFRQMHRVLYPSGSMLYTEKLLSYLTDESLAIWYMDDGSGTICKNSKTKKPCGCMTRLSTYCSQEEAELLKEWFYSKYKLDAKFDVDKRNNKYSLRFNTQDSRKFVSIVSPYMFQPLKYKIDHVDKYIPRVLDTLRGEDIV